MKNVREDKLFVQHIVRLPKPKPWPGTIYQLSGCVHDRPTMPESSALASSRGSGSRGVAKLNPAVEIHRLDNRRKVARAGIAGGLAQLRADLSADRGCAVGILNIEDWLAVLDEWLKIAAFVVCMTLLVDRILHNVQDPRDEGVGVLEPSRQTIRCSRLGQECDKVVGIVLGQGETAVVTLKEAKSAVMSTRGTQITYITVHIVRVYAITALRRSGLDTACHDVADIGASDVQPFLVRPAVHDGTEIASSELARVWTLRLIRSGTEVAHNALAFRL